MIDLIVVQRVLLFQRRFTNNVHDGPLPSDRAPKESTNDDSKLHVRLNVQYQVVRALLT